MRSWSEPLDVGPGQSIEAATRWALLRFARVERYALQSAAAAILRHDLGHDERLGKLPERLGKCLRVRHQESVVINWSKDRQAASFRGLTTCGSVWVCPCCAAKISERRRAELEGGIKQWESQGGTCVLITLTFSHGVDDELPATLARLKEALRRMWSGARAKKDADRFGIIGQVRALEVTHSPRNGWHPHVHALAFLKSSATADDLLPQFRARWATACAAAGLLDVDDPERLEAFNKHAVTVISGQNAGAYLVKMGLERDHARRHGLAAEVTKAHTKRGRGSASRTPFGILSDFRDGGELEDAQLFADYAAAFKGQRHLYWSSRLRSLLGLGVELTDEEIAAEDRVQDEVALYFVPGSAWTMVVRADARGSLAHVASFGDAQRVTAFLRELEARQGPDRRRYAG